MAQITVKIRNSVGFYFNTPIFLNAMNREGSYEIDDLPDSCIKALYTGVRSRVVAITEGEEFFNERYEQIQKAIVDQVYKEHLAKVAADEAAFEASQIEKAAIRKAKEDKAKKDAEEAAAKEAKEKADAEKETETPVEEVEEAPKKPAARKTTAKKVEDSKEEV